MNVHSATEVALTMTPMSGRAAQLLDAAAVCFARGGFRATTVAEISEQAGCSQGLLYRYFAGKDALIAALIERDGRRYVGWLDAVRNHPVEPFSALLELLHVVLAEIDEPGAAALQVEITAEAARGSALADALRRTMGDVLSALADVVAEGQKAGAFDGELDPHTTARSLMALVDGLTAQRACDPAFVAQQHAAEIGRLLENLLVPREGDTP